MNNIGKKPRKQRKDVKLTPDMIVMIENCLKEGMTHAMIRRVTGINVSSIAAVRLTLKFLGRL